MFVKIKLEPTNTTTSQKKTTFFPIENDGTLMDLKTNIELYVNVPAERQVLKTLNETMNGRDSTKIRDICDVEGSPILLLYSCDSYYQEELQFVCFLQIYNDKEALKQQEMEERAVKAEKNVVKSSTSKTSSGETLVVGSDSELETDSSNDCFESQSDSDSESDGTDISESSGGSCKKRQKNFKDNNNHIIKKMKTSPVIDKLSPTLFRYLDEFPKFEERKSSSGDTRNLKSPEKSNDLSPGNITVINNNTHTVNEEQNSLNNTKKIVDRNQNNSKSTTSKEYDDDISKLNEQTSTSRKTPTSLFQPITSTSTDINHPCKFIDPEFRKYLLIVSKTGNIISNDQCEKLLDWFFDRFRVSNNLEQLLFNNDAVTLFEGKLYIACMNEYASDWVKTNLEQYPESYAVQSLNEGNMCDVVIPMVSNNKKLSDVFELLEKQNSNLNTLEWYVVKRRTLLSDDDATNMRKISTICSNELVSICIDNASKKLLSEYHLKLKYCFWQIVFNFAST